MNPSSFLLHKLLPSLMYLLTLSDLGTNIDILKLFDLMGVPMGNADLMFPHLMELLDK